GGETADRDRPGRGGGERRRPVLPHHGAAGPHPDRGAARRRDGGETRGGARLPLLEDHRAAAPPAPRGIDCRGVPEPPVQRIAELRREPGELSFEARLAGVEPRRIWFRSETEVTPSADAVLAACLMPAMRHGGTLALDEPVSPLM